MTRYFKMLATSTDLRLTAWILSLFLFSSIFLSRHRWFFFLGKTAKTPPTHWQLFYETKSSFVGKKKVQLSPCVDQSVSHLSAMSARIYQGASNRKSRSSGAGNITYIKLWEREKEPWRKKTGTAYSPFILGGKETDNKIDSWNWRRS